MLTTEDFLAAGYKKFHQSKETIKNADFGLQKLFADEFGKRYYLTVFCYDNRQYQVRIPELKDFSFSPEVQFREGEFYNTVDVAYYVNENTKIYEIEDFYETIWETLGSPYYECYE